MVAQHAPFPYQRAALRRSEGQVVIKPAVGIGAFGAARLEVGTDDATNTEAFAHLEALAMLGDVLIQPMIPSVAERGEVSIVHLGGEYSHAVRKVPATGDFRVQDHHGGTVVDHEPTSAELAVARDADGRHERDRAPLYARADLVDLAGLVVMELELVEPELFLRRSPGSADRFAAAIAAATLTSWRQRCLLTGSDTGRALSEEGADRLADVLGETAEDLSAVLEVDRRHLRRGLEVAPHHLLGHPRRTASSRR